MATRDVTSYRDRLRVSRILCRAEHITFTVGTVSGVSNGQLQRSPEHCRLYLKTGNISVD